MAPSSVSPLSIIKMHLGLGKHRVQPRLVRSHGSVGHHSALLDGDHRSWHCPRHMDPDGDAIWRNPPLGCVRVCVGAGEGRHLPVSEGHRVGGAR